MLSLNICPIPVNAERSKQPLLPSPAKDNLRASFRVGLVDPVPRIDFLRGDVVTKLLLLLRDRQRVDGILRRRYV